MDWVKKYGGREFDYLTNLSVVEHVADKAKEIAISEEEIKLCDAAKEAAIKQIQEIHK
jgi:uncharacterized membrane protein